MKRLYYFTILTAHCGNEFISTYSKDYWFYQFLSCIILENISEYDFLIFQIIGLLNVFTPDKSLEEFQDL